MKTIIIIFGIIILFISLFTCRAGQDDFPVLKGLYLCQKPPGMTPEVFAPGIISTEATEGSSSFSKDGRFYLFARARSAQEGIFIMEQKNGLWSKPRLAPFSAGKHDWDFMLAPDGSYLIFCSDKLEGFGNEDFYISYRKRDGSWTIPVNMGDKVNSPHQEYIPYVTPDGKF